MPADAICFRKKSNKTYLLHLIISILEHYLQSLIMLKKSSIFVFFLLSLALFAQEPRKVLNLEDGWKFYKGEAPDAETTAFDDSKWQDVTVPHDWAIYGPFDKEIDKQTVAITQNGEKVPTEKTGRTGALPFTGTGWYRKNFNIPPADLNKKILLLFEGAMSEPEVYLNGKKVGEWAYGYAYFYFDISDKLLEGKNTLAVKLSNKEFSSRWYPGAGLYRPVSLIIKNPESINQWGTTITTPVATQEVAQVNVKTNFSGKNLRLVTTINDASGKEIANSKTSEAIQKQFEQNIKIQSPQLWSPENPYLYTAVTKLYSA
jgi:beta-galactosidase